MKSFVTLIALCLVSVNAAPILDQLAPLAQSVFPLAGTALNVAGPGVSALGSAALASQTGGA